MLADAGSIPAASTIHGRKALKTLTLIGERFFNSLLQPLHIKDRAFWPTGTLIYSAADLGIIINLGRDGQGETLHRLNVDYWETVLVDGEPVTNPFDIKTLPAGKYRLLDK